MTAVTLHRGQTRLLISMPHNGTAIPPDMAARMTAVARTTPDTDWHVAALYDFAQALGASILVPTYSRYVVDLNRPRDGGALYPGRTETGLCPLITFAGEPVYRTGAEPTAGEIATRIDTYWQPYHDALDAEIQRIKGQHGRVVLWDAHSIKSVVPLFFDGRLPDVNLGTAGGASCTPALQAALEQTLAAQDDYSWVSNGRFKGGYITRRYGAPDQGVDAVQMELAQVNYMDEDSFDYLPQRAAGLKALLQALLLRVLA